MDAIEVLTWFDQQGEIRPLKFIWEGIAYPIGSIGRRWEDADGWHVLVLDHTARVFELVFRPTEKRWYFK